MSAGAGGRDTDGCSGIGALASARTRAQSLSLSPSQKKPRDGPEALLYMFSAKFEGLFLQYHLLNASVAAARHPVEIHAGGESSAGAVTAIPEDAVITGCIVAALKAAH